MILSGVIGISGMSIIANMIWRCLCKEFAGDECLDCGDGRRSRKHPAGDGAATGEAGRAIQLKKDRLL